MEFHLEAVEKVLCFDNTRCSIVAALTSQLKESQETRRRMLMSQLTRQGVSVQGKTDVESNLFQILKMRPEDISELLDWIKDGKYLSHHDLILSMNWSTWWEIKCWDLLLQT